MAEQALVDQYNAVAADVLAMEAEQSQINAELDLMLQEAESLQKQADEKKAARVPLRQRREALSKQIGDKRNLLSSLGVKQQIVTDQQATAKAREEADRTLADVQAKAKAHEEEMAAKRKEIDDELARLKAAIEQAEKPKE